MTALLWIGYGLLALAIAVMLSLLLGVSPFWLWCAAMVPVVIAWAVST